MSEETWQDLVDLDRLTAWMDGEGLPGTGEIPQMSRLGGGSQNELYVVTRHGHRSIMRIPPPGADARRHDGLRRELTLLTALKGTDVPHGELVAGEGRSGIPRHIPHRASRRRRAAARIPLADRRTAC